MHNKINITEYFEKGTFTIPKYQRGYKWPVKEENSESSLEYFIDSLIRAYQSQSEEDPTEYFIEAVTVVEDHGEVILVDGQQRTTTLFLLFVVLKKLDIIRGIKINYDVRTDSHMYLNSLANHVEFTGDKDVQDIYYFQKALFDIENKLEGIDKNAFSDYVQKNVCLLYNIIPKEKAVNTFIALNGLKAIMKDEELIKSELLIKSSRIEENNNGVNHQQINSENIGIEWKINEDRGRMARNWDKWLYWWNQEKIKKYFGTGPHHPLYYLLITYWNINKNNKFKKENDKFSFERFKEEFIKDAKNPKIHFEGLRKLQKTFEDLYNNYRTHNFLGLILKTSNPSKREEALHYFLKTKKESIVDIGEYAKYSLIDATHSEIISNTTKKEEDTNKVFLIKKRKAEEAINLLNEKYVYWNENDEQFNDRRNEYAFRLLLLLNLLEDNNLQRKFDFSIWENRSLEHIFPKSKKQNLNFETEELQEGSIHCIGNLVLLYGNNNSEFGAKDFADKKAVYFNTSKEFKSRNLMHTISVFANSKWEEVDIIKNKKNTVNRLNKLYGIKS